MNRMGHGRKRRNPSTTTTSTTDLDSVDLDAGSAMAAAAPPATKKQRRQVARAASEAAALSGPARQLPVVRPADDHLNSVAARKWINRERVLSVAGRGVNYRGRHLLRDMRRLMAHHKPETKFDSKTNLFELNEVAGMRNATKVLFMESRKKSDLYLWVAASSKCGPSVRFLVENVHTLEELKLTGNCLKGSRPLLSFSAEFDVEPQLRLLKELFIQTFGTPCHHPKSQPFIDHIISLTWLDNRVWFRNYQLTDIQDFKTGVVNEGALVEIGPRFCLNPIKIFAGSFSGAALWENAHYRSPSNLRAAIKLRDKNKYVDKLAAEAAREATRGQTSYRTDDTDQIFQ